MIIQFCGLSGSGKTSIAKRAKEILHQQGIAVEVLDGDVYREHISPDLGFSRADRYENIRRLAFIAHVLSKHQVIALICAINPYEEIRQELGIRYPGTKTVYISCSLETLIERDTKALYHRAMLPEDHPNKISNLSGINDPFDIPRSPDLIIETDRESLETSAQRLVQFILLLRQRTNAYLFN